MRESSGPLQRPSGNIPRYARQRTVYLALLGCAVVFVLAVAGLWYWVARDSSTGARFKDAYRFPEYMPVWTGYNGGEYWNVLWEKRGMMLPYLILRWENCENPAPEMAGLMLGLSYGNLDVDLGAPRTAVDVDGTTGWLTRLSARDFTRPVDREERRRMTEGWDYNRSVYRWLLTARAEDFGSGLKGEAIALQWNKGEIHHILIANTTEPMTQEILFRIANSLSPAPYPSYNEINPGPPGCEAQG